MSAVLNIYIGNLEDDLSSDYLCMDIGLSDGTEIDLDQSEYLGSMSEQDFITILEGDFNRANFIAKELGIPVKVDLDSLIMACQDENYSEESIKTVKSLVQELR